MTAHEQRAFDDLRGKKCAACGEAKPRGHFFCQVCYFSLPFPIRQALYTHVLKGGAKIYLDTLYLLEQRRSQKTGDLFR